MSWGYWDELHERVCVVRDRIPWDHSSKALDAGLLRLTRGTSKTVLIVTYLNPKTGRWENDAICSSYETLFKLYPSFKVCWDADGDVDYIRGEPGAWEWSGFNARIKARVDYTVVEVPLDDYYTGRV
mgnify:FL=1